MKLDVISSTKEPWYSAGLQFTCTQCGNCCTGGPGYVWISDEELGRLATYLKLSPLEVVERYCRRVEGKLSFKEIRTPSGNYDCIFLTEQKAPRGDNNRVVHPKRGCGIYPVRPLQCRTWPFWSGNLGSKGSWERASKGCPGINQGRTFTLDEMIKLRDAEDWPDNPPTSNTDELTKPRG